MSHNDHQHGHRDAGAHGHDHHHHDGHDHGGHDHSDDVEPALQTLIWQQIEFEKIRTLNELELDSGAKIVEKSWPQRMNAEPELVSDTDEQMLMFVPYVFPLPLPLPSSSFSPSSSSYFLAPQPPAPGTHTHVLSPPLPLPKRAIQSWARERKKCLN